MKIVIGSHYFHPHTGGIERVAQQHATYLAARGHEVFVVSSKTADVPKREIVDGYEIRRYNAFNPFENIGIPYPLPDPVDFISTIDSIYPDNVDILHLHGLNYLSTSLALRRFPSEIPAILHQHTPFIDYRFPINIAEQFNDKSIGRWNLKKCDRVFAASQRIRDYVHSIYPHTRTSVIYNGVDICRFHPNQSDNPLPLDVNDNTSVFMFVSRMIRKKGVDILLDAAEIVQHNNQDVKFIIAGPGPRTAEISHRIQQLDNVEPVGFLPDETLPIYYAHSTGFLFTSRMGEAFPTLTMIESLSSGTPVIAAEIDDYTEGISDGKNGLLIPPEHPPRLAEAILYLNDNPTLAQEMGTEARKTAVSKFNIEDKVGKIEEIYYNEINRDRTRRK